MLAGTVYFYDNHSLIEEMDLEEYDELTKEEFFDIVQENKISTVTLESFSNNHQANSSKTILYKQEKK